VHRTSHGECSSPRAVRRVSALRGCRP
jgi:hypothetical protein